MTMKVDNFAAIKRYIKELQKASVSIGVPDGKDSPKDNNEREDLAGEEADITNSEIGFINEFGSPANNIPARPFLRPGVKGYLPRAMPRLKKAGRAALQGNKSEMERQLGSIGQEGADAVRSKITQGLSPGLKKSTLRSRKNRKIAPRTGELPLIDTGQFRNSISYVVNDGKSGR